VDLWAVTGPIAAPCGDRDEAVKVTTQTPPHVWMKLTELHRFETKESARYHFKSLNLNKIFQWAGIFRESLF
jgi:hypothetical protein